MPRRKSKPNKSLSPLSLAAVAATFAILGYIGVSIATGSGPVANFLGRTPLVAPLDVHLKPGGVVEETRDRREASREKAGTNTAIAKQQARQADVDIADRELREKPDDDATQQAAAAAQRALDAAKAERKKESSAEKVDCSVKCETIGSPVCSGSYVFTGAGYGEGGRACIQCGSEGFYTGEQQSCGDLISTGEPVIIPSSVDPTSIGLPAKDENNSPLRILSCVEKKGGSWVLTAFEQPGSSESTKDQVCGIGGWQSTDEFNDKMDKICEGETTSYCTARLGTNEPAEEKVVEEASKTVSPTPMERCKDNQKTYNVEGSKSWLTCASIEGKTTGTLTTCESGYTADGKCLADEEVATSSETFLNPNYKYPGTGITFKPGTEVKDPDACPNGGKEVPNYTNPYTNKSSYVCLDENLEVPEDSSLAEHFDLEADKQETLSRITTDAKSGTLLENKATYDPSDCKYGGAELSGKYGGTAAHDGKRVYECKNEKGGLGTLDNKSSSDETSISVQNVANGAVIGGGALGLGCAVAIGTGILAPVAIPGCIVAGVIIGGTTGALTPTSTSTEQPTENSALKDVGESCSGIWQGNDECASGDCKWENTTGGAQTVCSSTIHRYSDDKSLLGGELTSKRSSCKYGTTGEPTGIITTLNTSTFDYVVKCADDK